MTLVKVKPKRPTAAHRRRHGLHHRQGHDYIKTYWPYLPVIAVLLLSVIANSWLGRQNRSVLGYATDMSIQSLFDDTNSQREQNGEGNLAINTMLDQAAQAKADDMATRDYWSHDTPDGKTPWTFITAAGYTYQTAGENLAYGFDTAADTMTGWMNSPEHRANILNTTFKDVGFGIADIANYQNSGPETLVVAMYGSLATYPVAKAETQAAPSAPTPTPVTANVPSSSPAVTLTPTATPNQEPTITQPMNQAPAATAQPADAQQRITRFQLVSSNAPMNSLALSMFGVAAFGLLILRNGLAWRRVLVKGEALILRHPLLDVLLTSLASLSIVLSHTVGIIR